MMGLLRIIWLVGVITTCFGATTYNDVKSDYEAFLAAYEDTGMSGKSISAERIIPKDTNVSPLVISLTMALYAIMSFDAVEGKLEIVGSISMEWTDEVKTLKGVSFSSTIDTMFFTQDQIWTPNLVLVNAADSVESIGDETYKIRYNISSGLCQWNPRLLILASCTPDATYFPFDEQKCTLSIKPWGQTSDYITLQVTSDTWDTSGVQGSSVWDLETTRSSVSVSGRSYTADFDITIKRKPLFMITVIVLPVLLLSLLTGFLFLLPPASGERVGFGITCFLAFVVLLQTLMDLLPDSSDPMSLLCYYVILMLTLSGVLNIVNIILLRLYISPGKDEVPKGFIYFYKTIRCRPCRFCYRKTKTKLKPPCMTARDKVKLVTVRLYDVVRSIRCPDCKICLDVNRVCVQDTVVNRKFPRRRIPKRLSNLSTDSVLYDPGLERDGTTLRSRRSALSNEILTDRDIIMESDPTSATSRISDSQGNLVNTHSRQERTKSQFAFEGMLNTPGSVLSDESMSNSTNTIQINTFDDEPAIAVQQQVSPGSSSSKSPTQIVVNEHASLADVIECPSNNVSGYLGVEQESSEHQHPSPDVSSGYDSLQSDETSKNSAQNTERKLLSLDSPQKDLSNVDTGVISDCDDEDDEEEQEDEDEQLLSILTWEFVAEILDYFFLITFVALQVVFTMFFLVPLMAQ